MFDMGFLTPRRFSFSKLVLGILTRCFSGFLLNVIEKIVIRNRKISSILHL